MPQDFSLLDPTFEDRLPAYMKSSSDLISYVTGQEKKTPGFESYMREKHPSLFEETTTPSGFVSRPGYESDFYKKRRDFYEGSDVTPPTEEEKTEIKERVRSEMQGMLDAIEEMYSRLIGQEEERGVERLGRTRATAARGGILTSPLGGAQMERTAQFTQEQIKLLESERQLKKEAILTRIDERSFEEIRLKKEETKEAAEKYLTYLKDVRDDARADMSGMAEAGTPLSLLKADNELYSQLKEETGYSDIVFDTLYNSKLEAAERIDYKYTWKGNNLVAIGVDPRTNKMVTETYSAEELGIPVGVNVDFITNENTGEMFWYDKDNPELDAEGNLKMKSMGKLGAVAGQAPQLKQLEDGEWAWFYPGGRVIKTGETGEKPSIKTFLSNTDYRALANKGIPRAVSNAIAIAMDEGHDLDDIRNGLADQYGRDIGFGYLDTFKVYLDEAIKKSGTMIVVPGLPGG